MGIVGSNSTTTSATTGPVSNDEVEERGVHGLRLQKQRIANPIMRSFLLLRVTRYPTQTSTPKTKGSRPPSHI